MTFGAGVDGRTSVAWITAMRRETLRWMMLLLIVAAAGCGSGRVEDKSAGGAAGDGGTATEAGAGAGSTTASDDASATESDRDGDAAEPKSAPRDGGQSPPGNVVRLTRQVCVLFEPRWSKVRVGETLTWASGLDSPVTIHVSPGVFEKTEFVVPAGATVSTGPARVAGSFSIWSEPAACQGVPRGVQGAGPGVTVEDSGPR